MRRLLVLLAAAAGLASARLLASPDALDAELFPAEFLSAQREAIGLSEAQLQALDELMRQARLAFEENKKRLEESARALQTVLRQDQPDEADADKKMRAVLDHEGDIKLLHLNTLLAVRRLLTIPQLHKAREIRDQLMAKRAAEAGQRDRLEKKLQQLRDAIHARSQAGTLPPEVVDRAQEIQQLMKDGKDAEAERKAEETITFLNSSKP